MKKLYLLFVLLLCACSREKAYQWSKLDGPSSQLQGFWELVDSRFLDQGNLCGEMEYTHTFPPHALGPLVHFKGDSLYLFRYPYEYIGACAYELAGDTLRLPDLAKSMHALSGHAQFPKSLLPVNVYSFKLLPDSVLSLLFQENPCGNAQVKATAGYRRFSPDTALIQELLKNKISCKSLIGKKWYLEKVLSANDGSEPLNLPFPKGMPDSLTLTEKSIVLDKNCFYLRFVLKGKPVRMKLKQPSESGFALEPEYEKDKLLFSSFYNYGGYSETDTVYHEVHYMAVNPN